jgi:hypothetical protein
VLLLTLVPPHEQAEATTHAATKGASRNGVLLMA